MHRLPGHLYLHDEEISYETDQSGHTRRWSRSDLVLSATNLAILGDEMRQTAETDCGTPYLDLALAICNLRSKEQNVSEISTL